MINEKWQTKNSKNNMNNLLHIHVMCHETETLYPRCQQAVWVWRHLLDDQIMDDQHLNVASKTKIVFVKVRQPGLAFINIGCQNNSLVVAHYLLLYNTWLIFLSQLSHVGCAIDMCHHMSWYCHVFEYIISSSL